MNDSDSKADLTHDETAGQTALLTAEERYNRIAEAAYLRAAERGFAGGDPLQDWLDAEADLMKSVDHDSTQQERMR
jgi:hypothetical protein